MRPTVTEDFELILRWLDGGESTVRFSLASSSEFTISCQVRWERGLNYQGEVAVSFQTMCYGHDLEQFASELQRLSEGGSDSARFFNTGGDFEIRVAPDMRMVRPILQSELRYRHFRSTADVSRESELILPVGVAKEVREAARAIREVLRLLKVDCRSLHELPRGPA